MKITAAERLSNAMVALELRIDEYCQFQINNAHKIGLCVVTPKSASQNPPTKEVEKELRQIGIDHFSKPGAQGFYFQYFTPPLLPTVSGANINTSATSNDYQVTLKLTEIDDLWAIDAWTRALLYCAGNDKEMNDRNDWFELQHEAFRLTPQIAQEIKVHQQLEKIRLQFMESPRQIFEIFGREYVSKDDNLGISDAERKLYTKGIQDWKTLYPGIDTFLSIENLTLFDLYKNMNVKKVNKRNTKTRPLLYAFTKYIEDKLVGTSELPENTKKELIESLQGIVRTPRRLKYNAKRPAICLSVTECSSILYLLIREFCASPKKNQISGEGALYIWICQHVAFANVNIKVDDVLNICVTDIDIRSKTIIINKRKIYITHGLAQIIEAWIGTEKRENKRKFFLSLTLDNLNNKLVKISTDFLGIDGPIHPRDFLEKVHVLPGARISPELRSQLEVQEDIIDDSPYTVDPDEIKKQILKSINKNNLLSIS